MNDTAAEPGLTQNALDRFDTDAVPELSIFLPVYDEADNLAPLHERITGAMTALGRSYEVIYVDDGSSDDGLSILAGIASRDRRARVISFSRNYGQTAAMAAGIRAARGSVLIPMDADLQNDPRDIRRLLEKLDEGYDVVSGWRRKRSDGFLLRTLPSKLANLLVSRVGRVPLHDYGCTLKAYRSEILKNINLYGEMHRFIPIYAAALGARNRSRSSSPHIRKIEIRAFAHGEGSFRSPHHTFFGWLFDQTDVPVRMGGIAGFLFVGARAGFRTVDEIRFLAPLRRVIPNAAAGCGDDFFCIWSAVFSPGPYRRDGCSHLSRIAGQTDLFNPAHDQFQPRRIRCAR
jgi:glycosyltransferase involved in cell wall biosynthesis